MRAAVPPSAGVDRAPRAAWQAALRGAVLAVACLASTLAAAEGQPGTSTVTAVASRPAPAQAAAQPAAIAQRIMVLERQGRARPQETAAEVDAEITRVAPFSAAHRELLTVQGLMLAEAADGAAAERSALALDDWHLHPGAQEAGLAAGAALLIRATFAAHGGHDLKRADALVQEALGRLPPEVSDLDRYRFVMVHGYIKDRAGQLEEAVRLHHQALALADQLGTPWRRAEARTALAYSYFGARQLERARQLSDEALALASEATDWVGLGRAHNTAGIVLDGLGDQDGQRFHFEQAIACAVRAGSKRDEARYLANMADFYLKKGEFRTALLHAQRALPLARELRDPDSELVALANIGFAHISMQHLPLGKRFVAQAIAIDEDRGALAGAASTWLELGGYLEQAGDLRGAVAAYHKHRKLMAGVLRTDEQKAILAMQEQYDAEQRNRSLALLQREQQIKAEQLHRRDLQQLLWALAGGVSLLSFGVIVALLRRVRQANRLLSASNQVLRQHGERDPLTGLANRRAFQDEMKRRAADGMLCGTVYLIDVDHFKQINDHHGHAVGDAVLVEVAQRLRATLREDDLIVRWGGEEFLVLVQAMAGDHVDALAGRMLAALEGTPVAVQSRQVAVTASIGFASFPIGPASLPVPWERAVNLVDTAMYLAKAHGRNRAYGVRLRQAANDESLQAITGALEAAAQDGRVALTLLRTEGQARPVEVAA